MNATTPPPRIGGPAAALEALRAGYGALQLGRPGLIARRLLACPLDQRGRVVARVLGVRQLGQALASGLRPSYPVLALGVEVDLLHAASMLALGIADRRRRRAALTDALIASSFALGGLLAAHAAPRPHTQPDAAGALDRLRDRCADHLARALVPGYLPGDASTTIIWR